MDMEKILSVVFDITQDGVWSWDFSTGILTVKARWFEILGMPTDPSTITIERYFSLVHPEDLPILKEQLKAHIDGENQRFTSSHRLKKAGGNYLWIYGIGKITERDRNNQPLKMMGILRDISLEKEYKLALQESERQLKIAQEIAQIGSWYFDIASTKIKWSEQMFSFFEMTPDQEEPDIKAHLEQIFPDDREFWLSAVSRGLRGESYHLIFKNNPQNGNPIYLEAYGVPEVDENGIVLSLSGTCQDITDKVNTEYERAKLAQSSKLATLGEMASGIAHEINNPLTIIRGYLKMIEYMGREKDIPRDDILDSVKKAQLAIERTAKIVSSLKYFSRDPSQDAFENVNIQTIMEDTLSFCQRRLEKQNVLLEVKMPKEPLMIYGRPVEISQIILNLILNSFDAVKTLEPARRWVKVFIEAQAETLILRVLDNGNGVPLEIRNRIFEPFNTTKPAGQGTGLGLSISRNIAHSHNGELILENTKSPTTFLLTLPLV